MARLFLFFFMLLSLSACEIMYSVRSDVIAEVDRMIEHQQYDLADTVLNNIAPSHPQYSKVAGRKRQVTQLILSYENKVVRDAKKFEAKQQWQKVFALYRDATEKLPRSKRLLNASDSASVRYGSMIDAIRGKALIEKAKPALKELSSLEGLAKKNQEDKVLQKHLSQLYSEAEGIAEELEELGDHAFERKQYQSARSYWGYAKRLDPSDYLDKKINALNKILKHKKQSTYRANKTLLSAGINKFHAAIETNEFISAKKMLGKMTRQGLSSRDARNLQSTLQAATTAYVHEQSRLAGQLYSQGEIQQAYDLWVSLLRIAPNDMRIKADAERAERVLQNIEALRQRQKK